MRRLLPLLLALPALAGCADGLDVDEAEREIASDHAEQVVRSDARLEVAVRVTGDDGKIRWETVGGTYPGTLIARKGADALRADLRRDDHRSDRRLRHRGRRGAHDVGVESRHHDA